TPLAFVEFSRQRGLAPDGRCKPFAAAADGTGWSEGVGVVLLERLSDARRHGHPVLAVLRGSAVNSDGASNGLTAPNGPAQQRVIRAALAAARLGPDEVDAVEAHGTGTTLGDPIEAQALIATYGRNRGRPLWLGSVKSNIGHTQAAAGMAGLIKMVQAMRYGLLPRTLHVDEPTPHVDWSAGQVRLLTGAVDWPDAGRPRRAAVSSFGASGTNAHVILEAAPAEEAAPADSGADRATAGATLPWLLSGRTAAALRAQARQLDDWLAEHGELRPVDVAYALATTRAHLPYRAVLTAGDPASRRTGLAALAADEPRPGVLLGQPVDGADRVVFVLPGQGSQWRGMALELMESAPVFAARMRECAAALAPYLDWSIFAVLRGEPGAPSMRGSDVVQPVLFAIMMSLAELWRSYGVRPAAVVGHSQGEIAAACLAGAIPLDVAARMVVLRSRAIAGMSGVGAMGSVLMPYDRLVERLPEWDGQVTVAAVNGPGSVVVSGTVEAVEDLLARLDAEGVRTRRIQADGAGHSHLVEALREPLAAAFADVRPRSGELLFCSTVTGEITDTATLDPDYWWRNARHTVYFEQAARTLMAAGYGVFVELSPHPVLALALQETAVAAGRDDVVALGSLRRHEGALEHFLTSVGTAWTRGVPVDWPAVFA
ncbi:MAG TPA: type I polyketide synthase, partial [Micromonospora sp.]